MKRLILLFMIVIAAPLFSQKPEETFREALKSYKDGRFNDAILLFEKISDSGYESREVYYNLGNSYYRTGNYPFAILNYERAKKLDPLDEDISFNLQLANLKIVDKIGTVPKFFLFEWYGSLRDSLNSGSWSMALLIVFWLAVLLFAVFLYGRRPFIQKISFFASGGLLVLSILFFIFAYQAAEAERTKSTAIIIAPSIYVKSSPEDNSTDLFILREGAKVTVIESIGDWKEIRLADGKKGWIKYKSIEFI